ncbi:hypothetical protein FOL47_006092 [Perkinsus chesapeaki]|uniref:Uncharacterized protein n=1 Tax=Perkinsus chesapeaki TaxID=330153 RepID=A0A7J6LV34_PERCH|nr:hypothetical protein FOL47_006092 [Perkinsus chesapeaki]
MFGQQQPQFARFFGTAQPSPHGTQLTTAPFNVGQPTLQQPQPYDPTARSVQPQQPQVQGMPAVSGRTGFPMTYGPGAVQAPPAGVVNNRTMGAPAAGNVLQMPPGVRSAQPQSFQAAQRAEVGAPQYASSVKAAVVQAPQAAAPPQVPAIKSPPVADEASVRTIADLKASLATKTRYIAQLEQELEARNRAILNGPPPESPRGESIKKLKAQLASRDALIDDLRDEIRRLKAAMGASASRSLSRPSPSDSKHTPSPRTSVGGALGSSGKFQAHPLLTGSPQFPYQSINREDPVDIRVEEFYNNTSSAVPLRRINRKFYAFGSAQLEIDVVNGKLLARSEDGWNNGKYGAIEKCLVHFEPVEREKAGKACCHSNVRRHARHRSHSLERCIDAIASRVDVHAATSTAHPCHTSNDRSVIEGPSEILMSTVTNTLLKVTPLVPVGKIGDIAGKVTGDILNGAADLQRGMGNRSAIADDIFMPKSSGKRKPSSQSGNGCASNQGKLSDTKGCGLWAALLSGVDRSAKPLTARKEQSPNIISDGESSDWSVVDDTHSDISSHLEPVGFRSSANSNGIMPVASASEDLCTSGGLSPEWEDNILSPRRVSDSSSRTPSDAGLFYPDSLLDFGHESDEFRTTLENEAQRRSSHQHQPALPGNGRHVPASIDSLVDGDIAFAGLTVEEMDALLAADEALLSLEEHGRLPAPSSDISPRKAIPVKDDADFQKALLRHPLLMEDRRLLATTAQSTLLLPRADDHGTCHRNSHFSDGAIHRQQLILPPHAQVSPSTHLGNGVIKRARDATDVSHPDREMKVTECPHGSGEIASAGITHDIGTQPFAAPKPPGRVRSRPGWDTATIKHPSEGSAIAPTQPMAELSNHSSTLSHMAVETLSLAPPCRVSRNTVKGHNLGGTVGKPLVRPMPNEHNAKIVGVDIRESLMSDSIAPTQAMEEVRNCSVSIGVSCMETMTEGRFARRHARLIPPTQPMSDSDPCEDNKWKNGFTNQYGTRRCFEGPAYKKKKGNNRKLVRNATSTILQPTQPMETMGVAAVAIEPTQPMISSEIRFT